MKKLCLIFMLFICVFSLPETLNAQINIKDKIKSQTNNRANNIADEGVSKGLDKVEEGIGDLFKKKTDGEQANQSDTDGQQAESKDNAKPASGEQPLQFYSKFDFVPGEKVIFFDDFSQDAVGDFPALWNTNGSAEVVTTSLFPGNWMRFNGEGAIWSDQLLKLPDNYTIEFDIIPIQGDDGRMAGYNFRMIQSINAKSYDHGAVPGKAGFFFNLEYYGRPSYRAYVNESEGQDLSGVKDDEASYQKENQKYHISIWVQKSRVRLYQNETKLFDIPRAFPGTSVKMDRIRFEEGSAMVSNVRIAVGTPDVRNKLITEGKLVSYGIYFDVNKDVVKPESYATLKEIASILNEVPDVKVKIVGHTDSDGQDAANLDLSKRRAASVKAELAKSFGVNADRLETDGMGESQPIAPNDTPVNKALNRRVEFIKL
jgi:OmpA-OmpF porin, OOP family